MDYCPVPSKLLDGRVRWIPRSLSYLIWGVRANPDFLKECQLALDLYKGGDFLDVGAAWGTYSMILAPKARLGVSYLSFEPHALPYKFLLRNSALLSSLYPDIQFHALNVPVGDGAQVMAELHQGEAGHPSFVPDPSNTSGICSVTIDSIVKQHSMSPAFIKIDVEGAELAVLLGGLGTLQTFHPTLMVEIHPDMQPEGATVQKIESFLRDCKYCLRDKVDDNVASRQFWVFDGK